MTPMQIGKMRLNRASPEDAVWLKDTLARISAGFKTRLELMSDDTIILGI
jgi:poly-gamma-glutamate synthesis protein (capsule biosynthesis protein)